MSEQDDEDNEFYEEIGTITISDNEKYLIENAVVEYLNTRPKKLSNSLDHLIGLAYRHTARALLLQIKANHFGNFEATHITIDHTMNGEKVNMKDRIKIE